MRSAGTEMIVAIVLVRAKNEDTLRNLQIILIKSSTLLTSGKDTSESMVIARNGTADMSVGLSLLSGLYLSVVRVIEMALETMFDVLFLKRRER